MKATRNKRMSTETMVLGAMMTALVVVLQFVGSFIKFGPFSVSLVLVPIVIGAATCGVGVGAWLGLVFGVVVLLSGDAAWFMGFSIPGTVITVLVKGILCGLTAGLVYKAIKDFNKYAAAVVSAVVCPVVNTGVFALGCFVFFFDDLATASADMGYNGAVPLIFLGLIGLNFVFEIVFNAVLSPVIVKLIALARKEK